MNGWNGVNDNRDFAFLSRQPGTEEVNFCQAGGKSIVKRLRPGEPFLFKLHVPHHFIAGGGFFAYSHAGKSRLRSVWCEEWGA